MLGSRNQKITCRAMSPISSMCLLLWFLMLSYTRSIRYMHICLNTVMPFCYILLFPGFVTFAMYVSSHIHVLRLHIHVQASTIIRSILGNYSQSTLYFLPKEKDTWFQKCTPGRSMKPLLCPDSWRMPCDITNGSVLRISKKRNKEVWGLKPANVKSEKLSRTQGRGREKKKGWT